jgi:hypothetical protein
VVDALRGTGAFTEPQTRTFHWHRAYTRDLWLDQLLSHSDHTALPPAVRDSLLAQIGAAIDAFGGAFDMTYSTVLMAATTSGEQG